MWVLSVELGVIGLKLLPERDAPTLERITVDHVLLGIVVKTDTWAGYGM